MTSRSYTKQRADRGSWIVDRRRRDLLFAALCLVLISALTSSALAQETVTITVPTSVTFYVFDVGSSTAADESTPISFSDASLTAGRSLRISVKAEAADFTPPGGDGIPASNVSWTTSGAVGGSGSNGQLSSDSYTQVFQSAPSPLAGGVDLSWTLSAPGADIHAGNHTLVIRWKIESVAP